MTNEKKDKTLMSPVVKLEMKEPGKKRRQKDCEEKFKTCHHSLIIARSDSISSVPSAPPAAVSWSEKLLIVVLTACSQTGHYSPQPSTEWVCVWVGVCERVGRCAPQSWKCPKTSQQHYCHLHNWAFLFLKRFYFFPLFLVFSVFTSLHSLCEQFYLQYLALYLWTPAPNSDYCEGLNNPLSHQHATNAEAARASTVTLWFWEIAEVKGVQLWRGRQRTAEINHILCQCCKQKVEYRKQVYRCK